MSNGKYALITGGNSGIGYELAKLFARDGYNLVLVARNEKSLEEVSRDLSHTYGVEVLPIAKDLFNVAAPAEIYNDLKARNIEVTALVNDAGLGIYGPFVETDLESELNIIRLNIMAVVSLTKLFARDMVARKEGKIMQLSSLLGKVPSPLMAVYSASKAFVYSFSVALANELKDSGVTVTALIPGATATDFFHKAGAERSQVYMDTDLGDPAKVAKDGYEALMSGDEKVVSGFKNKLTAIISNLTPDTMLAENVHERMREQTQEELENEEEEKKQAANSRAKEQPGDDKDAEKKTPLTNEDKKTDDASRQKDADKKQQPPQDGNNGIAGNVTASGNGQTYEVTVKKQ